MFEKYRGQKVLITGGAGFVGSNLTDKLVELGAQVTVLDDLFTGSIANIEHFDQVTFIEGSVLDHNLVEKLIKESKHIFHLAARNIIISTKDPLEDCKTNIMGTLNVLLAARKFGIKEKIVVYASSASVYGNPKHLLISEEDAKNTLSPYSVSKLSGENYCYAFYESYGLKTVILRYSNVYGKGQNAKNPYCGVVAKFFDSCKTGEPIIIHGDGEQTRDYTYVQDTVEATLLAGLSERGIGRIYNVGTGFETSVNALADKIKSLYPTHIKSEYIDLRSIDNIRRRVLNIENIRRDLRWVPKFNINTGLIRTKVWIESLD